MTLNELAAQIHSTAVEHGWYEKERPFTELIALAHSELSEALEEYQQVYTDGYTFTYKSGDSEKPEGIPLELADVLIGVLDMCGYYGIDIDEAVRQKMAYNETRPYGHGNKRA